MTSASGRASTTTAWMCRPSHLGIALGLALGLAATASSWGQAVEGRITLAEKVRATIAEGEVGAPLTNGVGSLAFSPDGLTLAAGLNKPPTILLLDPETLEVRKRLTGHLARVSRLEFSPDDKTLVSAGHDGSIRLWDVAEGRERLTIDRFQERVQGLAVSPDGQRIYSGEMGGVSGRGRVQAWNAGDGKLLGSFKSEDRGAWNVALSPDGLTMATTSHDGVIRLWDTTDFSQKRTFQDKGSFANTVAFTRDGQSLAAVFYKDATLRLLDIATMRERYRIETGAPFFLALDVSPDGETLATADLAHARLRLWRASDGSLQSEVPDTGMVIESIRFAADGRSIAVGGSGVLKVFRLGRDGE